MPPVKSAMAKRNVCRAPRRAANQPLTGMSAATVARYAVAVMPICDDVTPKDRAMLGAAVATMVASRFSMKSVPATRNASGRIGQSSAADVV